MVSDYATCRRLALLGQLDTIPGKDWVEEYENDSVIASDLIALKDMGYAEQPPKSVAWQITSEGVKRFRLLAALLK